MEISIFSVKRKLGGVFASHEKVIANLQRDILDADEWLNLRNHPSWPVMEKLLTRIHNAAIQGFAQKGIADNERVRLNGRLELLQEIENEMLAAIHRGDLARKRYQKIKDKEERNARRQRPTG